MYLPFPKGSATLLGLVGTMGASVDIVLRYNLLEFMQTGNNRDASGAEGRVTVWNRRENGMNMPRRM